ncbi:helix-turn-helix domain-containing protein [Endozoicomonas sp.]|uniref:helix-turn-helix domain-containing protein n=1 Tax=Endozoicomonas sp. TaxID=1892382 RepID=UPI00383B9CCC
MSTKGVSHTTPTGGNVFTDLGFAPDEAQILKEDADRQIKADLKIQLMAEITNTIQGRDMKQEEAANLMGVSRPRVSDVMTGKAGRFTLDALVDMLQKLGRSVILKVS